MRQGGRYPRGAGRREPGPAQQARPPHAIRAVRGDELTGSGTLTAHVRRLRARIEDAPGSPAHIRTVQGRGHLFEAP